MVLIWTSKYMMQLNSSNKIKVNSYTTICLYELHIIIKFDMNISFKFELRNLQRATELFAIVCSIIYSLMD